ncbi:MAG: ATP-binding protein [Saprospiraceae bacterium]
MVSLNFLSRRYLLALAFCSSTSIAFAQTEELFPYSDNLSYWAVGGLIAMLGAWWLGKQDGREAERLLAEQKKKLENLRSKVAELQNLLKAKDEGIAVLERKLSDTLALKDQAVADSFSRDQFIAMVSQQMRDPLNEISAALRALSKEIEEEELEDHLYEIENAANELVVCINDILEQCKVEAGKVALEERKFDVRKLIEEVRDQAEEDSACSICKTSLNIHPRVPVNLVGDTVRLRQILTNLFQCVMDAEGTSEVHLSVAPQDLFLRNATLKFSIEGKTANDGDKPGHFESLIPNDAPVLKNINRLVRLQNGKMTVKRGEHGQLMVHVWLPFRLPGVVETNAGTARSIQNRGTSKTLDGYQILVAEDNKITQMVVAKVLRDRGAEVCLAANGKEAVEKFEEKPFDLVVMDINMPVLDGYKAVAKIRRLEQGSGRKVPIVALTSSVLLTTKEKALLHGMDEYVGKPFSIDDLMDKVSFCLAEFRKA